MSILQTEAFATSLRALRSSDAQARIARAVERMTSENLGDVKSLGGGLLEMRLHFGPGYRVYFLRRGVELIVLVLCGKKATQDRDIASARDIARRLPKEPEPWQSS